MKVQGQNQLYHGLLMYVLADTLAAQMLGGFKEGVGGALHPCRSCDVSKDTLGKSFVSNDYKERDEEEHSDRLQVLGEVSKEAHQYWSMQYGINNRSPLLDIPFFQVTKCLLHDPMHILLEGVVRQHLAAMLLVFIDKKKYFSLAELNTRITNFEYDKKDTRDKPQIIDRQHLLPGHTFAQSAQSMYVLMKNLPFMLYDKLPETCMYWGNFLELLKITLLVLSPVSSLTTVHNLRYMISNYNHGFVRLYPDISVTPKRHYLIHLPDQLIRFGPLRNHWCMRFEAKNGFFKLKRWNNFKNITKSLAMYHQQWLCLQMLGPLGSRSSVYLYSGDDVKPGFVVPLKSLSLSSQIMSLEFPGDEEKYADCDVMLSPSVTVHGHEYTPGTCVLYKFDDEPCRAFIDNIIVIEHSKLFLCHDMDIIEFESNLNAFCVTHSKTSRILTVQQLEYVWPIKPFHLKHKMYLMLQYTDDCWVA